MLQPAHRLGTAWRQDRRPKDQAYGMREFDVADLDGNMILFGMELKKS